MHPTQKLTHRLSHIHPKFDLSIGVGLAGIPNKYPYQALLFSRTSKTNFLEACATDRKLF
jgi:hypothetical protein